MSQIYAHRNGETEPPEVDGAYFFDGLYKVYTTDYVGEPLHGKWVSTLKGMEPVQVYLPDVDAANKTVYFVGTEVAVSLDHYVGRWWGPVILTPPWEQEP